jgi:hypothetical protein
MISSNEASNRAKDTGKTLYEWLECCQRRMIGKTEFENGKKVKIALQRDFYIYSLVLRKFTQT